MCNSYQRKNQTAGITKKQLIRRGFFTLSRSSERRIKTHIPFINKRFIARFKMRDTRKPAGHKIFVYFFIGFFVDKIF